MAGLSAQRHPPPPWKRLPAHQEEGKAPPGMIPRLMDTQGSPLRRHRRAAILHVIPASCQPEGTNLTEQHHSVPSNLACEAQSSSQPCGDGKAPHP